jgi:6-phospho-beta-glucosidase
MGLKIAVVGGASSYTPELFADLIDFRDELDIEEVVLIDPNAEKVALVKDVGTKLLRWAKMETKITASQNAAEGLAGADFVMMQIRVGGLNARVRDESLPIEFGMVGNETTGAGGFMCALRTVPAALGIAREVERVAPHAWLLNLSNPAGIVTEALLKHSHVQTVGFCNIPINTTYEIAEILGVPPSEVELRSFGLNHLSWARAAIVNGEDKLQALIAETEDRNSQLYRCGLVEDLIDPGWIRILGMIPSWYVRYYYCTAEVLAQDRGGEGIKGLRDMEAEEQLHNLYLTDGYGEAARRILSLKGGAQYYLPVLQVMSAIVHDSGQVIIADVQNGEALPDLPATACVEVPARIRRNGAEPLSCGPMPLSVRGLVQTVKAYEELTVEAATTGSHEAALAALTTHPLVGSYPKARKFWQRALEEDRQHLPQFFAHDQRRRAN